TLTEGRGSGIPRGYAPRSRPTGSSAHELVRQGDGAAVAVRDLGAERLRDGDLAPHPVVERARRQDRANGAPEPAVAELDGDLHDGAVVPLDADLLGERTLREVDPAPLAVLDIGQVEVVRQSGGLEAESVRVD